MLVKEQTSSVQPHNMNNNNNNNNNNSFINDDFVESEESKAHGKVKRRGKGRKETFCSRLRADICDRELLPLKILFFVKAGTVFVLYPYLNLHLKSLGLEADQAGLSNALIIFTIVGQPLAGVISDKIGNFKVFLTVITLITPIFSLLMLTIPIANETIMLPKNLIFSLDCSSQTSLQHLQILNPPDLCTLNKPLESMDKGNQTAGMIQCGQVCPTQAFETGNSKSFPSIPSFPEQLPAGSGTRFSSLVDSTKSNVLFTTAAKRVDLGFTCHKGNFNESCSLSINDTSSGVKSSWTFSNTNYSSNNNNNSSLNLNFAVLSSVAGESQNFTEHDDALLCEEKGKNSPSWRESDLLFSGAADRNCSFQCFIFIPTSLVCSNDRVVKTYNEELTFWLYNVLRVALGLFSSTCWIMFEGAVLAIIKERDGDYGVQRAGSFVAAIIAAPLSGFIISYFDDFRPAFYLYAVLQVVSGVLTMRINLTFKEPAQQIWSSLFQLLKKAQVLGLLFFVLVSGTAWGFLESFLFWYLQNLGGGGLLMGLTITVGGLAGLPFLILSKPIIDKAGHVNVIALGLIFYGIRLVGYSFIHDPWMCLPYETLEAITSSLAITAANTYASQLSCEKTVVSLQGIVGALYYTVGRAVGSLIGGYLIKFYGERSTYQIMAGFCFVAGLLYFLLNLAYNFYHRHNKSNDNNLPPQLVRSSIIVSEIKKEAIGNNAEDSSPSANVISGSNKQVLNELRFDGGYVGPLQLQRELLKAQQDI